MIIEPDAELVITREAVASVGVDERADHGNRFHTFFLGFIVWTGAVLHHPTVRYTHSLSHTRIALSYTHIRIRFFKFIVVYTDLRFFAGKRQTQSATEDAY